MKFAFLRALVLGVLCRATPVLAQQAPLLPESAPVPSEAKLPDRVGEHGVSAPVPLLMPRPKFPAEARKLKINGKVLIGLVVETDGMPSQVHVIDGLGHGLDESALTAVQAYRFKPALKEGVPVRVEVQVQIPFRIF